MESQIQVLKSDLSMVALKLLQGKRELSFRLNQGAMNALWPRCRHRLLIPCAQ